MKYIPLSLAALLLLCLAPMPYGYYQLVRFVSMVVFGVMAVRSWNEERQAWAITFGSLAVLFQPVVKIALGRMMWNIVDVVVAIILVVYTLLYMDKQDRDNNKHIKG